MEDLIRQSDILEWRISSDKQTSKNGGFNQTIRHLRMEDLFRHPRMEVLIRQSDILEWRIT